MDRNRNLDRLRKRETPWDVVIIGGGATGAGCLLDAASRGLDAVLIERDDFGSGTSSKSTKLIHGGVRYLEQRDVSLVREALRERGVLLANAPQFVSKQEFLVPCFSLFEKIYYGAGLKLYDFLSGKYSFGKSRLVNKTNANEMIPGFNEGEVSGGVTYFDGCFDDTELLIRILDTADSRDGLALNYVECLGFTDKDGKISGVKAVCRLTCEEFEIEGRVVVNATGIYTDSVRRKSLQSSKPIVQWSQGIHIVLDREWLDSDTALMIPKTSDGRLLFAIPFYGKVLVGTTDTKIDEALRRPRALEEEIDFVVETFGSVFKKKPAREDIRSVFAGVRPLVSDPEVDNTAKLSRGHFIETDKRGLVTITGGKWTTFRNMSEEAIDEAFSLLGDDFRHSATAELAIKGPEEFETLGLETKLHHDFPWTYADVIRATRFEMARKIEDVLGRRTRLLFVDARAAIEAAPIVAQLMASELR